MLKIGEKIEISITAFGSEGQGVGRADNIAVFVPGALPGEKVVAEVIKTEKRFAVARLEKLLSEAPERCIPPCPYYRSCGGCGLMHMDYSAQLAFKTRRVRDALERIGGLEGIRVEACVPSPEIARYRNKGVFTFSERNGKIVSGCLSEKSHTVVPIADCLIEKPEAIAALRAVTDWANAHGITAYDERTGRGELRHLMVRTASTGEMMAVIVTKGGLHFENELIETLKKALPGLSGIIQNENPDRTALILGRRSRVIYGSGIIAEKIGDLSFSVGAESFLQVNSAQTPNLYKAAIDALGLSENDDVIDLYCGIGTISLMMAKRARSVLGIEYVPQAIEDAKRNAARNGIENAEFICGAAENVLPKLVKSGHKIDKLLLDPPRKGAMPSAIEAIIASGVKDIAYISCNPATLARDCRILADEDYRIESVRPYDMFPNSFHVETVVLMTKN